MGREELIDILARYGISPTHQRVEIAAVLLERHQHLSAEQILHRVREGDARVSKATVYNTLGLFAQKGLIREVIVDPTKVFFDSNIDPHHHFYDVDSGLLADIEDQEIALGPLPRLPDGTVVERVDVIVRVKRAGSGE